MQHLHADAMEIVPEWRFLKVFRQSANNRRSLGYPAHSVQNETSLRCIPPDETNRKRERYRRYQLLDFTGGSVRRHIIRTMVPIHGVGKATTLRGCPGQGDSGNGSHIALAQAASRECHRIYLDIVFGQMRGGHFPESAWRASFHPAISGWHSRRSWSQTPFGIESISSFTHPFIRLRIGKGPRKCGSLYLARFLQNHSLKDTSSFSSGSNILWSLLGAFSHSTAIFSRKECG